MADGKIYKSDKDLNINENVWHEIRSIIFKKNKSDMDGSLKYIIDPDQRTVEVQVDGEPVLRIQREDCRSYAEGLREAILTSSHGRGTVDIPATYEEYLKNSLKREVLKASVKDTPDIWLNLEDTRNTTDKPLGFSIKSILSSPPTIFNPSDGTNIIYELTGNVNEQTISELQSITKHYKGVEKRGKKKVEVEYDHPNREERVLYIRNHGIGLKLVGTGTVHHDNHGNHTLELSQFERNLLMIGSDALPILSFMTIEAYFNGIVNLSHLVDVLDKEDPLNYKPSPEQPFYRRRVEDMLVAMTLSMTGVDVWDGSEGTNGGMIFVKTDGDVVCYHLFDRNDFREFLLQNMRFDWPSARRYFSTSITKDGDRYLMNLNVQIRMVPRQKAMSNLLIGGYYDFEKGIVYEEHEIIKMFESL